MSHHDVPPDLLELYEMLEYQAQTEGFRDLNELREVLIYEGQLDAD